MAVDCLTDILILVDSLPSDNRSGGQQKKKVPTCPICIAMCDKDARNGHGLSQGIKQHVTNTDRHAEMRARASARDGDIGQKPSDVSKGKKGKKEQDKTMHMPATNPTQRASHNQTANRPPHPKHQN
jgi:hypothetical protein